MASVVFRGIILLFFAFLAHLNLSPTSHKVIDNSNIHQSYTLPIFILSVKNRILLSKPCFLTLLSPRLLSAQSIFAQSFPHAQQSR